MRIVLALITLVLLMLIKIGDAVIFLSKFVFTTLRRVYYLFLLEFKIIKMKTATNAAQTRFRFHRAKSNVKTEISQHRAHGYRILRQTASSIGRTFHSVFGVVETKRKTRTTIIFPLPFILKFRIFLAGGLFSLTFIFNNIFIIRYF